MKRVNLQLIFTPCDHGYFALCPNLKGCYTQGKTYEEAYKMIMELVESNIKELAKKDETELEWLIEANKSPALMTNIEVDLDAITRTN